MNFSSLSCSNRCGSTSLTEKFRTISRSALCSSVGLYGSKVRQASEEENIRHTPNVSRALLLPANFFAERAAAFNNIVQLWVSRLFGGYYRMSGIDARPPKDERR